MKIPKNLGAQQRRKSRHWKGRSTKNTQPDVENDDAHTRKRHLCPLGLMVVRKNLRHGMACCCRKMGMLNLIEGLDSKHHQGGTNCPSCIPKTVAPKWSLYRPVMASCHSSEEDHAKGSIVHHSSNRGTAEIHC